VPPSAATGDPVADLAATRAENAALRAENAALKAENSALKAGASPALVPPPNLAWPPPAYGAPPPYYGAPAPGYGAPPPFKAGPPPTLALNAENKRGPKGANLAVFCIPNDYTDQQVLDLCAPHGEVIFCQVRAAAAMRCALRRRGCSGGAAAAFCEMRRPLQASLMARPQDC